MLLYTLVHLGLAPSDNQPVRRIELVDIPSTRAANAGKPLAPHRKPLVWPRRRTRAGPLPLLVTPAKVRLYCVQTLAVAEVRMARAMGGLFPL